MTRKLLFIVDKDGELVEAFLPPDRPEPTNLAYLETQGCRLIEGSVTYDWPEPE